ncbi:hypothetical protein GCM10007857_45720 [Bradyrhizobium iriomotense]|uniref:DUF2269 family protein n=1 Tax=Bradyrhizobium iriomotense TaxID=441950 RepID=A0ABQ6B0M3_9BRAD|nr:hypothetical protein GCM10007857_45720 [Bradyrhizobium iriomotense]
MFVVNRASIAFAGAAWRIHGSFTHRALSFPARTNPLGETMGHRTRPTAAKDFAPADLMQGLLVISSFGFWAVMLGLMPVLLFRVWLAG